MTMPLATACGLAAAAAVFTVFSPRHRPTALWFALAAIGQGAALSMTEAGPLTRYQHVLPIGEIAATRPWLLAIAAAQTCAALAGLWLSGLGSRIWHEREATPGRVALALLLSVATAATVSADVRRYLAELAFAASLQCVSLVTIALAAWSWPDDDVPRLNRAVARVIGAADDDDRRGRRFAWGCAAAATALAAILNVTAYERHPHVPDEVVYLHHAKYLAEGHLTLPAPPVPAAFEVDLMEYEPDRWFSPVPPGWPMVLAAGAWAGVPWLVNPVLAGVNVLLAFGLLTGVYSVRVARAGALLLAISPWFLFLGMSYMTHQLTLTAALLAAVGIVRARETGHWAWGFAAGGGVGLTSLIRPLDGVIVGGLIALWAFGAGGRRLRFLPLAGLGVGTALVGALVLPYNQMLTGDPLRFPINAYTDKHYAHNANAYGFGPDRGMGWPTDPNPGHSPLDGVINANLNTFGINTDLFGWAAGSLLLVTWLACSGGWRRADTLMMAAVAGVGLAYFPYYFSGGPDFGARYWFPIIVPLVALSARGAETLARVAGSRVWLALGLMSIMTLTTYLPWRAIDKYHGYRGMRADVRALAASHEFGADLILVRGKRHPDYASAFAMNPVDLTAPVPVYAWDRDDETRNAVLRAYDGRRVWILEGPSITGAGFRVAGGPQPARELLEAGGRR